MKIIIFLVFPVSNYFIYQSTFLVHSFLWAWNSNFAFFGHLITLMEPFNWFPSETSSLYNELAAENCSLDDFGPKPNKKLKYLIIQAFIDEETYL